MALPRPGSIFDAAPHPSASTGVNIAYPESYRRILGIAVHGRPNGPHQVIMRGAGDQENEDLVDAAADLSKQMFTWMQANLVVVVDGGVMYGHSPTLQDVVGHGPGPQFGPINVNGNTLTGKIESKPNPKLRMQGDPMVIYRKRIHLQRPGTRPLECVPVTMSRGWL
jgi:hypothetical protein